MTRSSGPSRTTKLHDHARGRARTTALALLAIAASASACSARPTQLRFDVRSDRELPYVEYLEITVRETSTGAMLDMARIDVRAEDWERSFALVPTDDPSRRIHVTIEASDGSGGTVAMSQVRARFVPGALIVVPVELSMLCSVPAAGARCGEDQTCEDGECAPLRTEPGLCAFGATPNCDLVLQDCPADQGCYEGRDASGNAMTFCGPSGMAAAGEACVAANDCAPGLVCLLSRVCARYCCPDADACPAGEVCVAASAERSGTCFRDRDCTVLPNAGCAATEMCLVLARDVTDCVPRGAGAEGAACASPFECGPDLLCVSATGGTAACRALCDVTGSSCTSPLRCVGVDVLPTGVGVCGP